MYVSLFIICFCAFVSASSIISIYLWLERLSSVLDLLMVFRIGQSWNFLDVICKTFRFSNLVSILPEEFTMEKWQLHLALYCDFGMYVPRRWECETTIHMEKFLSLFTSCIVIFTNLQKKLVRWLVCNLLVICWLLLFSFKSALYYFSF